MTNTLNIVLRLIVATLGAYALAVASSLAMVPLFILMLSSLLSDAVYAATMWSYVVFFIVFICAFSVNSVKRLYLGLFISCGVCLAVHFAFASSTEYLNATDSFTTQASSANHAK